jgi:predicted lipoprotein with Yx(FWY)xxD motif
MNRLLAITAVLAALALAACGDDDDDAPAAPETEAAQNAAADAGAAQASGGGSDKAKPEKEKPKPEPGTEIKIASSQFGDVLFDSSDQAIYLFDKETSSTPDCYGECAAAWPPVLTDGEPVAGSGADAKLLGTTERDDGSTQVTYNGHPLYYYAHEGPGEVLCHGVDEFGGLWLVVDAAGNALPA